MKKTYRPTVMDGTVVTIAKDFREREPNVLFGGYEAIGPYKISASRNQIIVHRCELKSNQDMNEFMVAFDKAWSYYLDLRAGVEYSEDFYNGEPLEVL